MITILGAGGFIGSHLVKRLQARKIEYYAPHRQEDFSGKHLGHVIYCIGVTADFRTRPLDTVEAHVCRLLEVMRFCEYDSLLYLSSTRLYNISVDPAHEGAPLYVNPSDPSDLYNISKAMGEALLHNSARKARIARISNVYGLDFNSDNFLSSVIKEALSSRLIVLRTSLDSEKDYVSIDDVADALLGIALTGNHDVYNVASGTNVTNHRLMEKISSLTGCRVEVAPGSGTVKFPRISIERIKAEFPYDPSSILNDIGKMVELYEHHRGTQK